VLRSREWSALTTLPAPLFTRALLRVRVSNSSTTRRSIAAATLRFRRRPTPRRTAFPDGQLQLLDSVVGANNVTCLRYTFTGTQSGPLPSGTPATNKRVSINGMAMLYLNPQGLIGEMWINNDQLHLLQQLGLVQLPASSTQAVPMGGPAATTTGSALDAQARRL
jgi:predicted ester cyclase